MTFFSLFCLLTATITLGLAFIVYFKNKKIETNKTWFILSIFVTLWSLGLGFMTISANRQTALFWIKVHYIGAILIPPSYLHFILTFLNIPYKKKKYLLLFWYGLGIIFLFFTLSSSLIIKEPIMKLSFKYYTEAGPFYLVYTLMFFICVTYAFYLIFRYWRNFSGTMRNQLKYILIASLVGFGGGSTAFFPVFYLPIYPWGMYFVFLYPTIISFAIVKYRLMDIKVAITRTSIFVAVYTLVLGLPFVATVGLKNWLIERFDTGWWMVPLVLMAVLATSGPYIFIYLERKAEERLLKEQRRYQNILKQASLGMTRIRNLQRLLNLIAHIISKTVKIVYVGIYIRNKDTGEYMLQVSRDRGRIAIAKLTTNNPLISWLAKHRRVLVYEEIKRRMQDNNEIIYKQLEENMRLLFGSVIIPSLLEDKFMGFIVLGEKISGQIYTTEDLNVFEVLASQAALAIENAQFYEETKEMQEQISQAEKMATIGTMADGLSHQINNRFYALSLIAGDSIDTIKMTDTSKCTAEVKRMIDDVNRALERIQSNVIQGGEVVRGMLKYSRRGEEGFESLELNTILDNTMEMVQFKVKLAELDIVRNFNHIPQIKGNLAQLEEVFFNFIDNAYEAIVERQQTFKEANYRGRIMIYAQPKNEDILEIVVEDNGIGVKNEDVKKIFTPFFTTKISSRKGTGLGLYVIRRIISEVHKGKIGFESQYKAGTRFIVELPIAKNK